MTNFVILTVSADGLEPPGTMASAVAVSTNLVSRILYIDVYVWD